MTKHRVLICLVLGSMVSSGCRHGCNRSHGHGPVQDIDKIETSVLGEVQVGKELVTAYVARGYDSAVLGFSVSIGTGGRG